MLMPGSHSRDSGVWSGPKNIFKAPHMILAAKVANHQVSEQNLLTMCIMGAQ